jgi:hypothetical protein
MLKIIKKSFKYLIILLGVLIILPTLLYLILQSSNVQTFLVKRITNHFSANIKSNISVGKVEYKFFNNLIINDLLITDKNNDTLLYSQKISTTIKKIDIPDMSFSLGRVTFKKPVVKLITDTTGEMNLSWYLSLIKSPADTTKKKNLTFSIDQVDISDARFSLINHTGVEGNRAKLDINNINLSSINGIIEDIKINNDSTSCNLYNLGFRESGGFKIERLSSYLTIAPNSIHAKSLALNCDSSIINISRLNLVDDSSGSFSNFQNVKIDLIMEKSLISSADLRYFVPLPDSVNESLSVSGKVFGTISELRGRNIELKYRDYTSLKCDFDISGLPKINNAFIFIGVSSLKTNAKDFEKMNIPGKAAFVIPDVLYKLGNLSFNGSFTGFFTDFVTYGEIRTNLGTISTDISLKPEDSGNYRIKGLITGSDIDLGNLTGKTELFGKVSVAANVDGVANSVDKFAGNVTGKIDSIEINKYSYRNIYMNGVFTEKTWDGSINIADDNIKMSLLGLLDFKDKLPQFDFSLDIGKANLYKLNIDKRDTSASLKMLLTAKFKGSNIDNLDGEIKLINSSFRKNGNILELSDFSIKTFTENNNPALSLRTDFLDADIRGYYNFAAFGDLFNSIISRLMPSQFTATKRRNEFKKNNFTFDINFKNTNKINTFFSTGLLLADKSFLRGTIFTDSLIGIIGESKMLSIKNNVLNDFSFKATISGNNPEVDLHCSSLNVLGKSEIKNLSVNLKTKPDNFVFTVDWDNKEKELNKGKFIARGTFTPNPNKKGIALLNVEIDSTSIYSGNNLWKFSQSSLKVDSNAIKISKLAISNNDRYYMVDGSISESLSDTLFLDFKGIDIEPLNFFLNKDNDPDAIPLNIKGRLNGKILFTNVYKNLALESNITVNNLSMLGSDYGNLYILSAFDVGKKVVKINLSNDLNGVKMIVVSGGYDPALKKIELIGKATKLPISFLNPLLSVFASEITGFASGNVTFSGEPGKITLIGSLMAEDASMKIDYLQTTYKINDSIVMDKNGFKFNNIKVTDKDGNSATLTGSVNHKNLKDYSADLSVYMNGNQFLVLNTSPKDNPLFYGTAYGSGVVRIKSGPNSLSFDISAKTAPNTKFSIPLNSGLSVSEYSFISFVSADSLKRIRSVIDTVQTNIVSGNQLGLDLNLNLEVTPDAEIQLIFDSKIGDVMKGHGSSENLNINLNKYGDFKIFGDYIVEDGEYTFTLGNYINKTFSVENGGKIMFVGDLEDAEIDMKASYKNLKTSLYPILQEEKYTERLSVEPQMNLAGKLFNPVVGFDIYLPYADEGTRAYLRNAISTEEEMNRQVFSLLILGSFISMGSATSSTTALGTTAMAATTFEMLSNQASNWLSMLSKDVDIGVNYRPGYDAVNPQEVQVALSTQLLNDKIQINSNIDLRGSGSNTSSTSGIPGNTTTPVTGDFDVEYTITEKIKFKVFNRYNNPYTTGRSEQYTQGIGIVFKQDFNKLVDLFRKKVKTPRKKKDDPIIQQN